ncbi:hypothetical protein FB451DRAFT_1164380 [Mycena latifolia]|nr:hypothetical protein FB451DRAFT_1164380 [Mycena latifolia]
MSGASEHDVKQTLSKAQGIFRSLERQHKIIFCAAISAALHLRESNTVAAKTLFQECLNSSWGKSAEAVSYCLERIADNSQWTVNDFHWSSRWTVVYLVFAKKTKMNLDLHKALQFLGDVLLHSGDEETAQSLFNVALKGFTYMDVHQSQVNCMLQLGDLAQIRGDWVETLEFWRNARPLFELSSQTGDVAQIDLIMLNAPIDSFETLSLVENTDHSGVEEVQFQEDPKISEKEKAQVVV